MAEDKKEELQDSAPEADEQKGADNEQETPKAKPGRKPQVRKSAKSEDEAADAESEDEDRAEKVRVVKEGDEIEVATTVVNGQKVATETVVQEYTQANSERKYQRLVARQGTIVK